MTTLSEIRSCIQSYLDNDIPGHELVRSIDDFVSRDFVYDYELSTQELILRYQDMFALFVSDPAQRRESAAYFGDDELRKIAEKLASELDSHLGRAGGTVTS